jgi:hypothetical protein
MTGFIFEIILSKAFIKKPQFITLGHKKTTHNYVPYFLSKHLIFVKKEG